MKKILCLVLVLLLVCANPVVVFAEEEKLDLNGFLEKYENADFNEMLDNPDQFWDDFILVCEEEDTDYSEWELNESISSELLCEYDLDVILFNMPVTIQSVIFNDKENAYYKDITFDIGDEEGNFNTARAFCEKFFDRYNDAEYIMIEDAESSESELRNLFSDGKINEKYGCRWSVEENASINCGVTYFYFKLDDFISSSVTIALQKNVIGTE